MRNRSGLYPPPFVVQVDVLNQLSTHLSPRFFTLQGPFPLWPTNETLIFICLQPCPLRYQRLPPDCYVIVRRGRRPEDATLIRSDGAPGEDPESSVPEPTVSQSSSGPAQGLPC